MPKQEPWTGERASALLSAVWPDSEPKCCVQALFRRRTRTKQTPAARLLRALWEATDREAVSTTGIGIVNFRPQMSEHADDQSHAELSRLSVRLTPEFSFERPQLLFEGPYVANVQGHLIYSHRGRMYDLAPDDRRFLMLKAVQPDSALTDHVVLVQNWDQELKRLLPVD